MSYHQESVAAMLMRSDELAGEKLRQLLVVAVLTIALTGCGLPAGRDVRAYDACIARHPQEVVVCEGPRQATNSIRPRFKQEQPQLARRLAPVTKSVRLRPTLRSPQCRSVPA
jgi:hypothetical protein